MNKLIVTVAAMLSTSVALADDLMDSDKLICSTGKALMCFEEDTCSPVIAFDIGLPDFVLIDFKKKTLSAVGTSDKERTSPIGQLTQDDDSIYLQGYQGGRAFSIVIDAVTGRMTAAVASDGLTITTFGACTDVKKL